MATRKSESETVPTGVASEGAAITPDATKEESPVTRQRVKVEAEDQVQLLNVTLSTVTYLHPTGEGVQPITVRPFEASPPMPRSWAMKQIGPQAGRYDAGKPREMPAYHWRQFAMIAPEGNEVVEFEEISLKGKKFKVNKYRDKGGVRPDGKPLLHTGVQALNFLRVCPNEADIQLFIEAVDGREVVRIFAADIIQLRKQQEAERQQLAPVQRRRRLPQ